MCKRFGADWTMHRGVIINPFFVCVIVSVRKFALKMVIGHDETKDPQEWLHHVVEVTCMC